MEFEDISSTGFIPKHLLKILTVIENEELRLSWKLIRYSTSFSLIVNGLAGGNGQTSPSKEPASGGKVVSRNINRPKHHHAAADTRLAEQPKRKKKKSPARVARDRERRKAYWKHIKVAKKLRAENLAAYHAQLQETRTLASPQTSEDSHSENTGWMELVSVVSKSHRHLTIESGTVKTACVQLDSSELSAEEVESEKSNNSSLDSDDDPDAFEMPDICTTCGLSPPEVTLQKCSLCKLSKYCSKQCQKINWREHKFACSIVAGQGSSK